MHVKALGQVRQGHCLIFFAVKVLCSFSLGLSGITTARATSPERHLLAELIWNTLYATDEDR